MQDGKTPRKRPRAEDDVIDVDAIFEVLPTTTAKPLRNLQDEVLEITPIINFLPGIPESCPQTVARSSTQSTDLEEEELMNPSVTIVDLFRKYNHQYFWSALRGVFVEFSSRMTSCAGTCTFRGTLGGCRIALSEPLLKYRPRSDLLSTLLHEMIHAYLFLTEGIAARDGHDGHGPKFLSHASRINMAERGRVNITPYHSFIDEVNLYRVHHWQCTMCACIIKRAMNRAPAPRDPWWPRHKLKCGGDFIKVKEPPKPEKKETWKKPKKFRGVVAIDPNDKSSPKPPPGVMLTHRIENILCNKPRTAQCPVCGNQVVERLINEHLDDCISGNANRGGKPSEMHVVNPSDTAAPLSGRLFMDRHKGSSSRTKPSQFRHNRASGSSGVDKQGESVPVSNNLQSSGCLRGFDENINESSILFAIQTAFGRSDALQDYTIRGLPIKLNPISIASTSTSVLSELAGAADRNPIISLHSELTCSSLLDEARALFDARKSKTHDGKFANSKLCSEGQTEFTGGQFKTIVRTGSEYRQLPSSNVGKWQPNLKLAEGEQRQHVPKIIPNTPKYSAINESTAAKRTPCPFCSKLMLRIELDEHVSICLQQSDIGLDLDEDSSMEPRVMDLRGQERQPAAAKAKGSDPNEPTVAHLTKQNVSPNTELVPCPFCDRPFQRMELEVHTSSCIVSLGLMEEF